MLQSLNPYHMMARMIRSTAHILALLGVLFIPFPFNIFPYQSTITDAIFGKIILNLSYYLFSTTQDYQEISSDSSSMYILIFILIGLSVILSVVLLPFRKWYEDQDRVLGLIRSILCYYLALQLLKYGADKIFKSQFYLPEPNILYTPLGNLDKDILFWSTMGTSYAYNVFLGSIEMISALLLIYKRTRVIGLLLACGIFTNIIAINFSFDISVKLYSTFLFIISLLALGPIIPSLYKFLTGIGSNSINLASSFSFLSKRSRAFVKISVILLMSVEVFYPNFKSGNFNDDAAPRPFLHGAYAVQEILEVESSSLMSSLPIKRVFIHRNGYIIFQDLDDEMRDFKLDIDLINNQLLLTDYFQDQIKLNYQYSLSDSILGLQYYYQGKEYKLVAKGLDWRSLPALGNVFHWTVDG